MLIVQEGKIIYRTSFHELDAVKRLGWYLHHLYTFSYSSHIFMFGVSPTREQRIEYCFKMIVDFATKKDKNIVSDYPNDYKMFTKEELEKAKLIFKNTKK